MIKLILIFIFFGVATVLFYRSVSHAKTRTTGVILLLLALVCFSLYAFDFVGIGLSEQIIKFIGKTGEMP